MPPVEADPLVDKLLVASTLAELSETLQVTPATSPTLTLKDLAQLASTANLLALSDLQEEHRLAFEIASRVLQVTPNPAIAVASETVLARLGNFPGLDLVAKRTADLRAPPMLRWEERAHRVINTVEVGAARQRRRWVLTDFQKRVFEKLRTEDNISFSGPTSSGKSFLLALDVVDRLFRKKSIIVYLVPTRALIREVVMRVRKQLETHGLDVPVRSIPVPLTKDQAAQGAVFVLTQERLLTLLFSSEGTQRVDVLIVDEAQSLGENARGVVLHAAIDAAIALNPQLQIFFGSPLSSNPRLLIEIFQNKRTGLGMVETVSPVTQNIIVINRVKGKPNTANLNLLVGNRPLELGTVHLPFRSDAGVVQKRAQLALAVTAQDDATVVYANGRAQAEEVAQEIAIELQARASTPTKTHPDPDVREAIRFLRDHIHPKYPLIEYLQGGVAVHYGSMPGIVRNVVEDLFRGRKIRFIVTTSTLLQGVNLPARNIVIFNPHRGREKPMTSADFRNLAGRAGRLSQEFHGNVWVLHPHQWDARSHEGPELNPIESAFDAALKNGGKEAINALDEKLPKKEPEYSITTLGKLYQDYGPDKASLLESRFVTPENAAQLVLAEQRLKNTPLHVSKDVLRRNSTLHPIRLNNLAVWMLDKPLESLIPLHPKNADFYDNFEEIVRITDRILERSTKESYRYYTFLANLWIGSKPLREILHQQLAKKRQDPYNANTSDGRLLTEILDEIEKGVRYHLVKNVRAYADALRAELTRRGVPHLAEKIPSLHLYLECGSSNQAELNLISLGLSRTTAILVAKHPSFKVDQTPEETLQTLRRIPLASMDLPQACKDEIWTFIGKS